MRIPLHGLAALPLLLAACTVPCRPVPHGQEPLGGIWYFKAGDNPVWALPGLDETDFENGWRVVDVPGALKTYTKRSATAGWLRVRFAVPEENLGKEHVLLLGRADARLEPWLNGRPLRPLEDDGEPAPAIRAFPVPRARLREENVLAIRSANWEQAGGIAEGPIDLVLRAEWERRAAKPPAALREIQGPHARAVYDPNAHRLTTFAAGNATILDDVHFVLRTKVRAYDLGRIPETEIELLPDGRGIRTLHVLAGEQIRFEAWYLLPASVDWPVLAVVGEARAKDGRPIDVDLVYHAASRGVIGAGGLRTAPPGTFAWGRLFVHAPKGDLEILPESVRKHYRPEGAFELHRMATAPR